MIKPEYRERITKIIDYIHNNLDSSLTTESLAGIAFLSKSHFKKVFKEISGENISDYVKRTRLAKAHFMLLHNQHRSITDIAFETGFSSSASFARAFKQYYGISASDLRKDNENESIINFGIPFMHNSDPDEYEGYETIYSIADNFHCTYYFGSEFGEIYIYNNGRFKKIKLDGLDAILSLSFSSDGTLWVGSAGDFGYIETESGEYNYTSLLDYVPENEPDFNQIWKIVETPEGIYFQTRSAIIRWHENRISIIRTDTSFHSLTYINQKIYLLEYKKGLVSIDGDKLITQPGSKQISEEHIAIYNFLPYDNEYIFCLSRNTGCWLYNGKNFIPMQTEIDHIIDDAGLLRAVYIPGTGYAIGTRTMGVLIINKEGKIISVINSKRGLMENYIRSLHYTADGTLLIGMMFGISMLDVNLPVMIYNENTGIKNMISSICRYRGHLYIGTQYGIVRENHNYRNTEEIFRKIPDINSQVHHLIKSNKCLCIAYAFGLYIIAEDYVLDFNYDIPIRALCQSSIHAETIFAASNNCIFRFHFFAGRWHKGETIENIPGIHSHIVEDSFGNIFITGSYNKVHRISFQNIGKTEINTYTDENGVPDNILGLVFIRKKIYITSERGILLFDEKKSMFVHENLLGGYFNNKMIHELVDDGENLWVIEGRSRNVYCINTNKESRTNFNPILEGKNTRGTAVYPEENGSVWIGCRKQLIQCNIKENKEQSIN